MIRRAYVICTEDDDLKTELSFITHIFHTINGYPQRIIERSQEKMKAKLATTTPIVTTDSDPNPLNIEDAKQQCIVIPYAGARGEKIMKKIVRNLPENVRPKVMYKGTKLSSFFSVKDKSDDHHCSNIVYYYQRNDDENVDYIGETKVRFGKRIKQHQGGDKGSSIVIDFKANNLAPPSPTEFTILAKNYTNRLKRRIAESLFIKDKKKKNLP